MLIARTFTKTGKHRSDVGDFGRGGKRRVNAGEWAMNENIDEMRTLYEREKICCGKSF